MTSLRCHRSYLNISPLILLCIHQQITASADDIPLFTIHTCGNTRKVNLYNIYNV
jgi:hypothetical protein